MERILGAKLCQLLRNSLARAFRSNGIVRAIRNRARSSSWSGDLERKAPASWQKTLVRETESDPEQSRDEHGSYANQNDRPIRHQLPFRISPPTLALRVFVQGGGKRFGVITLSHDAALCADAAPFPDKQAPDRCGEDARRSCGTVSKIA